MIEKTEGGWWPSLHEPFRQLGQRLAEWFAPRSEARGTDSAYKISLELPGVTENDVEITVHEGLLTVKGEKKVEREEKGENYFFSEREYGRFQRTFRLPADADASKAEASFANGVLTITIPKRGREESGARRIKVKAA